MNPREVIAAGAGGALGTAIDVGALVLLVEHTSMPIPAAAFVSALSGAALCFVMNKHLAFRDRTKVTVTQVVRFGLVAVATAVLMALAMRVVAVDLRVPYLLAKALCAALVFVVWTYPAQRRLVFRRPEGVLACRL